MLDTIVGRSPTHKEHIQSWACPEARSRPGEPSYPLPAGFIRRWLLDRGSSATHHRSGGHQPAHQSMINRRLMIVPPAMPSSFRHTSRPPRLPMRFPTPLSRMTADELSQGSRRSDLLFMPQRVLGLAVTCMMIVTSI